MLHHARRCLRTRSLCPRLLVQRQLWMTRTVVSDSPRELLEALPSTNNAQESSAALFTISRNVPGDTLSKLVEHFQNFPSTAIGCLTNGSEDGAGPYRLSYALHKSPQSILEMVVPFRSSIAGTPKIALGREVGRLDNRVYDGEWAGDAAVAAEDLPEALKQLEAKSVSEIIYFSDEQPQGLMKTLDSHLPQAAKLGLLASSTPFVTGRPHTLITGKSIHSDGAVGIAVCRYPARGSTNISIDYNQLQPLGEPLEVTVAKGNIILELASSNATRLLLERIQLDLGEVISKEQGFYMGLLPEKQSVATLDEMTSVRPILAGDPSRGALSLDTEANIRVGQYVQFFRTASRPTDSSDEADTSAKTSMFRCSTLADASHSAPQNVFSGISEHGVVVGKPDAQSWICSVEGSCAAIRL